MVALESVARLVEQVEAGLPLGPGAVQVSETGEVIVLRPAPASRHHFFLDGVLYRVSLAPQDGNTLFQIWAELGFMPYTIEDPKKRMLLATVLRAAQGLERARFVIDEQQKILVLGQREVPGTVTLTDLMFDTVQFLQEARPFIRVVGQYL